MPKKKQSQRVIVKKPPMEQLRQYYDLWVAGKSNKEILVVLDVTQSYLKKNLPAFHEYCRQRVTDETRRRLADEGLPAEVALTVKRRQNLLRYVSSGASLSKAADVLGVPLTTITEIWFKEDTTLRHEVLVARDKKDLEVAEAIAKRAIGYSYNSVEMHEESMEESGGTKLGDDGASVAVAGRNYQKSRTVTKTIHVPGAPASQRLFAINRLGWSDSPQDGGSDNDEVEYDIRERLYEEE